MQPLDYIKERLHFSYGTQGGAQGESQGESQGGTQGETQGGSQDVTQAVTQDVSSPHFLHHFHYHFALTGDDLLDAVVELEEGILTVDDEAGRTGLAHQDAALTKREGTIARLKHRTIHSMKGREMTPLMMLTLFGTGLTGARLIGERLTGARQLSLIRRRRFFRLQAMQEQHLAMMERTLGYLHPILTRSQIATLTLYGVADALMVDETTLAV